MLPGVRPQRATPGFGISPLWGEKAEAHHMKSHEMIFNPQHGGTVNHGVAASRLGDWTDDFRGLLHYQSRSL